MDSVQKYLGLLFEKIQTFLSIGIIYLLKEILKKNVIISTEILHLMQIDPIAGDHLNFHENKAKLDNLFGSNAAFEFNCPICKGCKPLDDTKLEPEKQNRDSQTPNIHANVDTKRPENRIDSKSEHTQCHSEMESTRLKSQFSEMREEILFFQSKWDQLKLESEDLFKRLFELLNSSSACTSNYNTQFNKHNKLSQNESFANPFNHSTSQQIDMRLSKMNDRVEKAKLYEIFVTPFELSVQCDQIVQHILKSTNIAGADMFCVERLGWSSGRRKRTFVSFKISTLNFDVYKSISDNKIWLPSQSARNFIRKSPRKYESTMKMGNRYNFNDRRSQFVHQMPQQHRNFQQNEWGNNYQIPRNNNTRSHWTKVQQRQSQQEILFIRKKWQIQQQTSS